MVEGLEFRLQGRGLDIRLVLGLWVKKVQAY